MSIFHNIQFNVYKTSEPGMLYHSSTTTPHSPLLRQLHWLPINSRIDFKIILLTHKCIYRTAPTYLQELITVKTFARETRQSQTTTLIQPKARTVTYGERSFSYIAPKLWNTLPSFLRIISQTERFKTSLKTHLFNKQKY